MASIEGNATMDQSPESRTMSDMKVTGGKHLIKF